VIGSAGCYFDGVPELAVAFDPLESDFDSALSLVVDSALESVLESDFGLSEESFDLLSPAFVSALESSELALSEGSGFRESLIYQPDPLNTMPTG